MRAWVLLGVCLAACLEPALVECPDDLICPTGYLCDPAHRTCLLPEQLESCRAMPNDANCLVAGAVGYCRDEVCLPISCGNGVVDLSEICDDGNLVRGDGCNATCSSDETCGNGVIDTHVGELCDDANHLDGDGCDSRCRTEQEVWTIEGLALGGDHLGTNLVYDETRAEMVFVGDGTTWTWNGARWVLRSTTGMPAQTWSWHATMYVPDRQSVIFVGNRVDLGANLEVWEWTGTQWSAIAIANAPRLTTTSRAVYDRSRHVVLVTGTAKFGTIDLASGAWTDITAPPASTSFGTPGLAFDEARGIAVYAFGNNVFEWNGTTWTQKAAVAPASSGFTMMYDPVLAASIAFGGDSQSNLVSRWTGASWVAMTPMPVGRRIPSTAFDRGRGRWFVFGGENPPAGGSSDVYEWTGTGWQTIVPGGPPYGIFNFSDRLAHDPERDVLLKLGGLGDAMSLWSRDGAGTWTSLTPPPVSETVPYAFAYDPLRDGFVYNSSDFGTWLYANNTWKEIEAAGTSEVEGMVAMAYDPSQQAMIGLDGTTTWELRTSDTHWKNRGPTPESTAQMTLAYDARRNTMLAGMAENAYDYANGQWTQTLSPGPFFTAVADVRRGSVLFIRGAGTWWERRDGAWYEEPGMSTPAYLGGTGYASPTGALALIASVNVGWLLFERRFVGSSPRDACMSSDEDGDDLVGCADADCWLQCTPACPPFASCQP